MLVLLLNAFDNRGNCHWASNSFIPALATFFEAGSWHRQNRETETLNQCHCVSKTKSFFFGGGGGKFYQVSIIMIVTMLLSNTWTCVW